MNELKVPVRNRQVLVEALVAATPAAQTRRFIGLVDTGSQRSAVSQRVIEAIGSSQNPVEYLDVGGIGSASRSTPAFWLWLGVELAADGDWPVTHGCQLSVWRLPPPAPPNFDVLVGMDFLSLFEIALNDQACTFRPL